MQIERVNIEDVYIVEDEYGNQYLSRDYSLKANQDYVDELAASFGANGEPNEPPVLVRDGGVYYIKAGNSRYMAMKKLGTKTFTAVIDEDDTKQSLIEAAIRTNTKKQYEDVEESRFVQQLLLLCPDDYVSEVTKLPASDVAKARRVAKQSDEAAYDMTLERLIALADFDEGSEEYDSILNASEDSWKRIADAAKREQEEAEIFAETAAALEALGAVYSDDTSGLQYHHSYKGGLSVPTSLPVGSVYSKGFNGSAFVYVPAKDEEIDPEEAKQRALDKQCDELYAVVEECRESWLTMHYLEDLEPLMALSDDGDIYTYRINMFIDDHELQIPNSPAFNISAYLDYCGSITSFCDGLSASKCERFMTLTDALRECGYEPCPEEETLYGIAKDFLLSEEGEDDE